MTLLTYKWGRKNDISTGPCSKSSWALYISDQVGVWLQKPPSHVLVMHTIATSLRGLFMFIAHLSVFPPHPPEEGVPGELPKSL